MLALTISTLVGRREPAFTPASLFTSSEQGAWYDPSDFSTLYQNSAGTTAVTTVEQPVGLMLDKSKGLVLGSELVNYAAFVSVDPSWTIGANSISAVNGINYGAYQITLLSGKFYKVTVTVTAYTSGTIRVRLNTFDIGIALSGLGTQTGYGYSNGTPLYVMGDGSFTGTVTISVKELPGNHAFQSTSTARPVLRARYNALTWSEDFSNAYWGTAGRATILANTSDTTDPLGGNTADKMVEAAPSGTHRVQANGASSAATGIASSSVKASVYFKKGTRDWGWVAATDSAANGATAWFDLANGVAGTVSLSGTGSGASSQISSVGNGWYRCTLTVTPHTSSGDVFAYYGITTGDAVNSYAGDITKHIYIWGAQLVAANVFPSNVYQRIEAAPTGNGTVTYATGADYPNYLYFDGSDDSLSTASIDFSATDEMSVFAGLTKNNDAALQIIYELSANLNNNNGTFHHFINSNAGLNYGSKGDLTVGINVTSGFASPVTLITTGRSDISADFVSLRANKIEIASSTADQGSGNYGNYPLYIGSRAGTSLRFNGRLYGLIVRGKTSTLDEITSTETWMSGKTGV